MIKSAKDFGYMDRRGDTRLPPSETQMDDHKKELIRTSLQFPIIDVVTFMGYKGDAVTKITTLSEDATEKIEKMAKDLGFEVSTTMDSLMVRRIHCAFPNDVYGLK